MTKVAGLQNSMAFERTGRSTMRKVALLGAGVAAMLVLALPLTPAWAQNTVSYVSGSGDTNLSNT